MKILKSILGGITLFITSMVNVSSGEPVVGYLDNGVGYVYEMQSHPKNKVYLRLCVNAGSLMEADEEQGYAHFLEHMAYRGIKGYPGDQLIQKLQGLGMKFGAHVNAETGLDHTVYKFDVSEVSDEQLEMVFKIMRGIATDITFEPSALDLEKGVVLAESRFREKKGVHDTRAFRDFIYGDQYFLKRYPIGKESTIQSATSEKLKSFYNKWYTPEGMTVVVVGDVEEAKVEALLKKHFNGISRKETSIKVPDWGSFAPSEEIELMSFVNEEVEKKSIYIVNINPAQEFSSYREKVKDRLLSMLCKGAINLRFITETSKEIAFPEYKDVKVDLLSLPANKLFDCQALRFDHVSDERGLIVLFDNYLGELRRINDHGFFEKEIVGIKEKILDSLTSRKNQSDSRLSKIKADELVQALIQDEGIYSLDRSYEMMNKLLEEISVEDCNEYFKEFLWCPDLSNKKIYISTSKPYQITDEQVKGLYSMYYDRVVENRKEKVFKPFEYDFGNETAEVFSEKYLQEVDAWQYVLSNGVRVNIKSISNATEKLHINANFGYGIQETLNYKPSINKVVSRVFPVIGTRDHSYNDLVDLFSFHDVELPVLNVNDDNFQFQLNCGNKYIEEQLKILCAYLIYPGYSENLFSGEDRLKVVGKELLKKYLNQNVDDVFKYSVLPEVYNDNPRLCESIVEENFAYYTGMDVKAWLDKPFTQDYMEVTFVGDFDKDELLKVICATLGRLPKRDFDRVSKNTLSHKTLCSVPSRFEFKINSEVKDGCIIYRWPLYEHKNAYEAELLAGVINERLRKAFRVADGASYVSACYVVHNDYYDDASTLSLNVYIDPERSDEMELKLRGVIHSVLIGGIESSEFEQEKLHLLENLKSDFKNNVFWAKALGRSQENKHWTYNELRADLDRMSLESVNLILKEVLQPGKRIEIVIKS